MYQIIFYEDNISLFPEEISSTIAMATISFPTMPNGSVGKGTTVSTGCFAACARKRFDD
jgi:hypothetical protein